MKTTTTTTNMVSSETMKNIKLISNITNLAFIPVSIDYMFTEWWNVQREGLTVLSFNNNQIDNLDYLLKNCIPYAIDKKETISPDEFWDIVFNYNPFYKRAELVYESFRSAIRLHRLSSLNPTSFNEYMDFLQYFILYKEYSNDWYGDYDSEYLDFNSIFTPVGGSYGRTKKDALECKFRIKFELSNFIFRSVNIGTISFHEYSNISRSGNIINLGESKIQVLANKFYWHFLENQIK